MISSVMKMIELGVLNNFMSNIINEMGGGSALSKDMFYIANTNGGVWLILITERYQACEYNRITLFLKRDQGTRDFVEWQFREKIS
jgi:hypothetical protein